MGAFHALALKWDGTIAGWGWNDDQELGLVTAEQSSNSWDIRSLPLLIGSLDLDG